MLCKFFFLLSNSGGSNDDLCGAVSPEVGWGEVFGLGGLGGAG